MNTYKLIVVSDNFIQRYTIQASTILQASTIAKTKFIHTYKDTKIKVHLDEQDIGNHINEILSHF